jgi:succinate dehydrogenase / fumarate reductase flavoprotein subunit
VSADDDAFAEAATATQARIDRVLAVRGRRTVTEFHRELGKLMWDHVGMTRNQAGLELALGRVRELREQFWQDVVVAGEPSNVNKELEKALRVADYLEFAEVLTLDALHRTESCGGHFREESQMPDGEARRDDEHFAYVAAWEYPGPGRDPILHKEPLLFENVHLATRSYA